MRTRASRALRTLRPEFYDDVKCVPLWLEDELSDRMLAIWFLDDGYLRQRTNRRPAAEIATNAFSDEDIQVLLRGLTRLGLPAKSARGRIFFDAATTLLLSERIAPFTPPSMRYKLHPDVEACRPFDPTLYEAGKKKVLFDYVQLEDVTRERRTDRTFFCLDVEETHNFVTSGGVVHNCRPPGNRNPLAEEIESCEPHLWRQIELIQPTLIATLGNFATKLLSGKPNGITQVHGREQQVSLGGNAVTIYPIFHPAAALYTPRMLQVLEEDFARIPALLRGQPAAPAVSVPAPEPVAETTQLGLF